MTLSLANLLKQGAQHAQEQTRALCWLELRPAGVLVRATSEGAKPVRECRIVVPYSEIEDSGTSLLPIVIDNAVRRIVSETAS